MARSKKSGEPGTPLIIALVFFILLSIGLGVMYYLGLADTAAEKAKATEAENKSKADAKLMNDAKAQAGLYRVFLGIPVGDDEKLVVTPTPETKDAVRAEHTRLVASIGVRIEGAANTERTALEKAGAGFDLKGSDVFRWDWPANGALPASPSPAPLADRVVKLVAERELALKQASTEKLNATNELKALKDEKAAYTAAIAKLETKLNEETVKLAEARKAVETEKKDAIGKFETASATSLKGVRDAAQQVDELTAKNADLLQKIAQLEARLKVLEAAQNEATEAKQGAFARNAPHGQITARRRGENVVEINLGSADNLKPGVTFAVQPHDAESLGLDRKRNVTETDRTGRSTVTVAKSYQEVPKGKLEVVRILGANAAEARITEEVDYLRDSIFNKDLLYNPLWRKGARDRVVLFGIFDVNGDGTDDTKAVVGELERRGVTVDGYYDLATRKWESLDPKNKTPGPTQATTYAVRGWTPEAGAGSYLAGGVTDVANAINAASTEVKTKGVQEVKANRFFPVIGYKLEANAGSTESVNSAAIKFIKDAPPAPMEK